MKKNITKHGNPINIPIDMYRGDTFQYTIKAYDENGDPFDFSNCTFKMDVKDEIDGNIILSIETDKFEITDDTEGQSFGSKNILKIVSGVGMEDLDLKKAVYDIEMTYPNGEVMTLQRGEVTIRFDVTLSTLNV